MCRLTQQEVQMTNLTSASSDADALGLKGSFRSTLYCRLTRGVKVLIVPLLIAVAGCQTTEPLNSVQQSTVLNQFVSGSLRLTCDSVGCAGESGYNRQKFVQMHNTGMWRDLVIEVARVNFNDQMSYWYLARAAESSQNIQAARIYYNIALTHSKQCDAVFNLCDFPVRQLVPQRLALLDQYERQVAAEAEAERQRRAQAEEAARRQVEQARERQRALQQQEAERVERERKMQERQAARAKEREDLLAALPPIFGKRWQLVGSVPCTRNGGFFQVFDPNLQTGKQQTLNGKAQAETSQRWTSEFMPIDSRRFVHTITAWSDGNANMVKIVGNGVLVSEYRWEYTLVEQNVLSYRATTRLIDLSLALRGEGVAYKTDSMSGTIRVCESSL